MFDLKKLFQRHSQGHAAEEHGPGSDYHPSGERGQGLEVEYQRLIAAQFRRWGIAMGCVSIEVRKIGTAADGYDVFVAMIRLMQWERHSALRVLLGLPLLEAKIRKAVRETWLADYAHFVGLWLHSSEHVHDTEGMSELRRLMKGLAPLPPAAAASTEAHSLPGPDSQPLRSEPAASPRFPAPASSIAPIGPVSEIPGIVVRIR